MPCFRRLTPSPFHWFLSQVSLCLQGLLVLYSGFLPSFALAFARGLAALIENPFQIKLFYDSVGAKIVWVLGEEKQR